MAIPAEVTSIKHQTINIDSHEKTISTRISRSDAPRYPGRESCTKRLDFTRLLGRTHRRNGAWPYAVNPFPNNACLTYRAASTGTIAARYDVTNTAVPSTPVPPWTIFEFGYVDTGLGSATAILYELNPCVPNPVSICRIVSVDNQFCGQCTFPNNTFNFLTNLYFVEVTLNRPAGAPAPQACTLRTF